MSGVGMTVLVSTAAPTNVVGAALIGVAQAVVPAAGVSIGIIGLAQDVSAGNTIGVGVGRVVVGGTTGALLAAAVINGYLFP